MKSSCYIPEILLEKLRNKLDSKQFDIGNFVSLAHNESYNGVRHVCLVANNSIHKYQDIFIIDHLITFAKEDDLEDCLASHSVVRQRLSAILQCNLLPEENEHLSNIQQNVKILKDQLWQLIGCYKTQPNEESTLYYILDEIGSRLVPQDYPKDPEKNEDIPSFHSGLVEDVDGIVYTVVWPCRDIEEGEILSCANLTCIGLKKIILLEQTLSAFLYDSEDTVDEKSLAMIHSLQSILESCSYNVVNVAKRIDLLTSQGSLLPVWDLSDGSRLARYDALSKIDASDDPSDGGLNVIIKLFLLGVSVDYESVVQIVDSEVMDWLVSNKLIQLVPVTPLLGVYTAETQTVKQNLVQSLVQLIPVATPGRVANDLWVVTDFAQTSSVSGIDPVMYIGPDSLGLTHAVAKGLQCKSFSRGLDLCSGSGIQGLMALRLGIARSMIGVEINSRAAAFSRFNAILNGYRGLYAVKNCSISEIMDTIKDSDSVLSNGAIDIILANPPYIPSLPVGALTTLLGYGDGGPSGEEVVVQVFQCAKLITVLSRFSVILVMVGNLMNVRNYDNKIYHWLSEIDKTQGFVRVRGCVVHGQVWSVNQYSRLIIQGLPPSATNDLITKHSDSLMNQLIGNITNGIVMIRLEYFMEDIDDDVITIDIIESDPQLWEQLAVDDTSRSIEVSQVFRKTGMIVLDS